VSDQQIPPPGPGGLYQQYPPPGWQQYPAQPPKKRHTVRNVILGVVGGFVLIIVIAAVASAGNGVKKVGNSSSGNTGGTSAQDATTPSPSQSTSSTTGPVGITFQVTTTNDNDQNVSYTVTLNKVIQIAQPDNSFDTAPSGEHLAAAEFTIKGVNGIDQDDANSDAVAIGANQQSYQPGFEGLAAGTNFDAGDFNTSPGSTSVGWVAFEVKNGVKVTSIQWSGDFGMAPATWTVG
jgi:hypothetical protein